MKREQRKEQNQTRGQVVPLLIRVHYDGGILLGEPSEERWNSHVV